MANINYSYNEDQATKWIRYIARAIALTWAVWWTIFMLLSGAAELGGGLRGILMNAPNALPGLALLASVAIAWRWQLIGGILLVLEAAIITVVYFMMTYNIFPHSTIIFVLLTIALPPLVAGSLLLTNWRRSKILEAP